MYLIHEKCVYLINLKYEGSEIFVFKVDMETNIPLATVKQGISSEFSTCLER